MFSNERGLTDAEIQRIRAWVDAAAPAGDSGAAPAPRVFSDEVNDGWTLGKPDFVVRMPESFLMRDFDIDAGRMFHTTLTERELPEDVSVRGWEIRAGTDGHVVHHMWVGVLEPGEKVLWFYSDGLLSIESDGNLLTDRRVVSYWEDEGIAELARLAAEKAGSHTRSY